MTDNSMDDKFNFSELEEQIYRYWEENGFFKPTNDPATPSHNPEIPPYVISIPPPNVTGELHLGHALFVAMEDLMIRYNRMKGVPTLWVPGTDHAGIATQLQIEKSLAREGLVRDDIGREEFIKRTWQWKEKYGGIITKQIRRLGASCDWSRERFTLDEGLSKAVREAFVSLFERNYIYRGMRLINWSPGLKTAVSDLEVEYREENGSLYYFKYILSDSDGDEEFLAVATTRPETILGDTAVAVHPEDVRYQKFVGRYVIVPILGRKIPVIADAYVDREFGTGALKVTPGHDPNDYEIGRTHNLPVISVLDKDARITAEGGPYFGLDRFECRKQLWEDMAAAGLVIKEEPHIHQVPISQRGGEIVEPMISTQWFVSIKPLAEAALRAVQEGKIKIIPEHFTKIYYNWLENIQDWCISRQLWWGHRIPVWYCNDCNKMTVTRADPIQCKFCESTQIEQDPDVLDTWFSSALWPFSTLGWPQKTKEFKYFYPTTMMETGYDILFFWVARMIMFGLEFTGKPPFSTVYLHGIVRDENGRKMSKTTGNVIDPLSVMEQFGTDALRFTLLVGSTPGKDMNLSLKKVEANRNFANKVWNIGRFVINSILKSPQHPIGEPDWTIADSWIWAKLQQLIRSVDRLFSNHLYGEAGKQISDFLWGDFADWYVEIAKLQLDEGGDRSFYTSRTLVRIFDICLRMLHPFTPYITEELWRILKTSAMNHSPLFDPNGGWPEALIIAPWPFPRSEEDWEAEKIMQFDLIQEIVRAIRNIRAEKNVKPSQKISAILVSSVNAELLRQKSSSIAFLARLNPQKLTIMENIDSKPEGFISIVAGQVNIFLPFADLINKEEEKSRLEKELVEVNSQIQRLEGLLASSFSQKAPAHLVGQERDKLNKHLEKAKKIIDQLDAL